MNGIKKSVAAAAIAGSMFIGGIAGAVIYAATAVTASAATNNLTAATATPAASGTFKSNEDPTHEKGESAAREAQENAGQVPTVP